MLNVLLVCVIIGNVDKGVVEVTNCFCVPHKEHDDQVEAELSYALDVYELNRRVNSSEVIVGKLLSLAVLFQPRELRFWRLFGFVVTTI